MKRIEPDFSYHEGGESIEEKRAETADPVFDADGEYDSLEGWEEDEER